MNADIPVCVRCGLPISDTVMYGMGDGRGQRFGHPVCYWRTTAEQLESDRRAQAARIRELGAERDALLEAANAMARAADRVVRGEGTLQRYEYLTTALERWLALVAAETR